MQGCGGNVDPSRSGQWWNGGWQRWGESEWEGEKTSSFRSDDRGSITLIEKSKGYWIENEICEKTSDILAYGGAAPRTGLCPRKSIEGPGIHLNISTKL